jgi:hypothetical protein
MTLQALIEKISEIREATATDPALKARFVAEPMTVLAEMGVELPQGVVLETHGSAENEPAEAVLTFPSPPEGAVTEAKLDQMTDGRTRGYGQYGGWGGATNLC